MYKKDSANDTFVHMYMKKEERIKTIWKLELTVF